MRINEISPRLYKIDCYKYIQHDLRYQKIECEKSQYLYRFLYVTAGELNICIENKTFHCCKGDIVYLLPGEIYRFELCGSDFSIYNMFFDILPDRRNHETEEPSCVFLPDYIKERCLPLTHFDDAQRLNKGCVFKNVDCIKQFEQIMTIDRSNESFDFHTSTAIRSIISCILMSAKQSKMQNTDVNKILAYIRLNPDKDLSASRLSDIFSYHKNYINHLVKLATGKTLCEYVRSIKIEHAKSMLAEAGLSLTQIALSLGYYDYSHFYKSFICETGITPTDYLLRKEK